MAKQHGNVILRFDEVDFEYGHNHPILDEVSFVIREGAKLTLMGQNGAGKTTIFNLITGEDEPTEGGIHIDKGSTIATSLQVIPRDMLNHTITEFFQSAFSSTVYDIDKRAGKVMDAVNLSVPLDRKIGQLSGGQQARLLLAFALIQEPDILLLDEPTNNLDKAGIEHLTKFLVDYPKTCIVISHDAEFLNTFTHGVLYLDVYTRKIEQYVGDYHDVVKEISARIERERKENARLQKEIEHRKEKANFFAQKGGKMRNVAKKMKQVAGELEDKVVEMRREDKTINDFHIPLQDFEKLEFPTDGNIVSITSVPVIKNHERTQIKVSPKITLGRNDILLIEGPNGVGKTTFLKELANKEAKGSDISTGVKVGYYQQDFSGLDYDMTAYEALVEVAETGVTEHNLRSTAAQFLITQDKIDKPIHFLSEGQKGLLSFARFVLQRPGLLILDEPTNHINFRHLPIIAKALNKFNGSIILVSHMKEFVSQVKVTKHLDLGKF
ncbi:MAG: hypothetical protein COU06_00035 [Candidatus Harrisonbacteria bacterium CG10_big_fil_rev_8_21_14_0_10_38_8]|uniref:ABC transporter domain-containing protein n=1 Tax=Candidatus Harrisonbacteria bacterium CG10_big_fil_rev_8_21_14_0_10_38_8 TaxID=1974582 RepID=A0A2M6WKV3_9BACT|nr:MAG: hypothetical protein COU06_00035 [Candidatus Harrisonbacteria bacterium CG10_big_fil_rev_8_21_14_0_10_38_8]